MQRLVTVAALTVTVAALLAPAGEPRVAQACGVAADSLSYHWPVKPFHRAHAVRGNFGDPRTMFRGEGIFSFHNGVDIVASPWTPVYPVVSGTVVLATPGMLVVAAGTRRFQYRHLLNLSVVGERVVRGRTVLGLVTPRAGHVHLAETRDGIAQNPLSPGHLVPYGDTRPPVVRAIRLEREGGTTSVVVEAYDLPARRVAGAWRDRPVTPAALSWSLSTADGTTVVGERVAVDFRESAPHPDAFWHVYAPGTFQNFRTVGRRFHFGERGRYLFRLASLTDDDLPGGTYVLRVTATDVCGNRGSATRQLEIERAAPPPAVEPVPAPAEAEPEPAPTTEPAAVARGRWPVRHSGYTVVIASIPREGRAKAARETARVARASGLRDVGVLLSDRFPSLRPGYWVVFSGVYPTLAAAEEAAAPVRRRYAGALPRPVVPRVPVAEWPEQQRGYTIVLASLPKRAGLAEARRVAAAATSEGVRAGVLDSSRFPGLAPGYYVVFAGVYGSGDDAQRALSRAARLYPTAYPRAVG